MNPSSVFNRRAGAVSNPFPNLPARYQHIPAGDAVTPEQSRGISIPLSIVALGGLAILYYLSSSQLKIDRSTRRNPRRRAR